MPGCRCGQEQRPAGWARARPCQKGLFSGLVCRPHLSDEPPAILVAGGQQDLRRGQCAGQCAREGWREMNGTGTAAFGKPRRHPSLFLGVCLLPTLLCIHWRMHPSAHAPIASYIIGGQIAVQHPATGNVVHSARNLGRCMEKMGQSRGHSFFTRGREGPPRSSVLPLCSQGHVHFQARIGPRRLVRGSQVH